MKKIPHTALHSLTAVFLLSACTNVPIDAYYSRGTPESLLDMSAEAVNIRFHDRAGMDELTGWINREAPSRAELQCAPGSLACADAERVLNQFNVEYTRYNDGDDTAALYYERVMARDCENRFIDNTINPYNFNHPTFGCSIASNMVQMVSDRRQFINPALMPLADGAKASQAVKSIKNRPLSGNPSLIVKHNHELLVTKAVGYASVNHNLM